MAGTLHGKRISTIEIMTVIRELEENVAVHKLGASCDTTSVDWLNCFLLAREVILGNDHLAKFGRLTRSNVSVRTEKKTKLRGKNKIMHAHLLNESL